MADDFIPYTPDFIPVGGQVSAPTDPITQKMQAAAPQTSTQPYFQKPPVGTPFPSTNPIEAQGQRLDLLGQREQRAMQSPTPVTSAASVIYPAMSMVGKLPSVRMTIASKQFEALKSAIGNSPVNVTDELKFAADEMKNNLGASVPKPVNDFITRMAETEKGPLTYNEARSLYHNVSDLSATDKMAMNKNMSRLLGSFKTALGDAITTTTEQSGHQEIYKQAMSGFAKGAQAQDMLEAVKNEAMKYVKLAAIGGGIGAGYKGIQSILNIINGGK